MRRDDPGLHVRRGTQVKPHAARDELAHEIRVVDRQGTVRDPLRVQRQGPSHLRRAAPLAGVQRHVQADRAPEVDRGAMQLRVREACLLAGEVHGDEAGRDSVCLEVADEREVRLRRVRSKQGGDQADLDALARRRRRGPATDRLDHLSPGEPAVHVQQRRPADLRVPDVVEGLVLDEVGGRALERIGILHQRDRQVEREQQLCLVRRLGWPDEDAAHALERAGGVDSAGAGDLERGVDAQRAVQVEVQLRLGHRANEGPEGARIEVAHRRMVGARRHG